MLDTVRWLTPQAALGSWYQERFDAPIASNAAQVATAFAQIDDLIDQCDRPIVLAGFSQGACLAAEYVLQSRKTVTALIALTGSRSEEHTSALQSLMRLSYAVFCLKKKK